MDAAKLEIVTLRGAPRARGRAHGEYFAERISELLERWGEVLELGYGVDRRRYVDLFFAENGYEHATEKWAARVLEEVRGHR